METHNPGKGSTLISFQIIYLYCNTSVQVYIVEDHIHKMAFMKQLLKCMKQIATKIWDFLLYHQGY